MVPVELSLLVQGDFTDLPIPATVDVAGETIVAGLSESQWQIWFEQWLNHLQSSPTLDDIKTLGGNQSPLPSVPIYEVSLVLATDAEIRAMNATYRQIDSPTDVLAFAALEWEGPLVSETTDLPLPLGDIVISVETAVHQAIAQGHPVSNELVWLSCHGLLHLLGWDHPDAEHLNRMLSQQTQLMDLIGLDAPSWSAQDLGYLR